MKKIGILTHYYESCNIGGLLQAYALPALLNRHHFLAEQISFDFNFYDKVAVRKRLTILLRGVTFVKCIKYFLQVLRNLYQSWENKKISAIVKEQKKVFLAFRQFIPHSLTLYNNANISQSNAEYDVFITGSDQVFSSYLLPLSAYYGEFATSDKKVISYGASSDVKQFSPKAEEVFAQKIKRLNVISVREKTLKEYVERLTDQKVDVVLDPVFLLSPQEWLALANPVSMPQKPYVFCYFLGSKSGWQRKKAQEYADKYGYEVIHLPYVMQTVRSADRFLKNPGRWDVGPREFITLIHQAQCVFTDSFHGLAFSINFGKNFYVFDRDDQSGPNSMNARITDTVNTFNLVSRHIIGENMMLDNAPVDFTEAHKILAREKGKSVHWLLDALGD